MNAADVRSSLVERKLTNEVLGALSVADVIFIIIRIIAIRRAGVCSLLARLIKMKRPPSHRALEPVDYY